MSQSKFIRIFSPYEDALEYERYTFDEVCTVPANEFKKFAESCALLGVTPNMTIEYFENNYKDLIEWAILAELADVYKDSSMWICVGV